MYTEIIKDSGSSSSSYSADELELFLSEPLVDYKTGSPFKWWHDNKGRFPLMGQVARFLNATATSLPSEWLFSKVGLLYKEHQNRILAENTETLLFIKGNYNQFGRNKQ